MSAEEARHVLATLLERHGSWQIVSALLGESVENIIAVYGGQPSSPVLMAKLLALRPDPVTPKWTTRG